MSNTVFILGAGASAGCNAPVMANFLDVAQHLSVTHQVGDDEEHFDRTFRAIHKLHAVFAKSYLDINDIESIHIAFEMAELLGSLPGIESEEIQKLTRSLRRVIVRTLNEAIGGYGYDGNGLITPWDGYRKFAEYLLAAKRAGESVSVITFNYDCVLDYAIACLEQGIDYGLETHRDDKSIAVYKLHGSLNWRRDDEDFSVKAVERQFLSPKEQQMSQQRELGYRPKANLSVDDPFIVPPALSKTLEHRKLQRVWRGAAKAISDADNIVVCGYSLPPTDMFFRYFFAIASLGPSRLKRFVVFDAYLSNSLNDRYGAMLGPMVRARYRSDATPFGHIAERLVKLVRRGTDSALKSLSGQ